MSTMTASLQHIVLNDQQAQLILNSNGKIELLENAGNRIGFATPDHICDISDEDIRLAKEALGSDQPRYTTQQVLEHLGSLKRK